MQTGKRVLWVDWAKFLCIYFVAIVHTPVYEPVYEALNAFLIPMFFFLSGLFFSYERYPEFVPFLKLRWKQLMVPYFTIAAIAYVFWLLIGRHFGDASELSIPWYDPLVGTVLGYGKRMVQSVPLWFVMALFVLQMIHWLLGKYVFGKQWIFMLFLVGAGVLLDVRGPVLLPLELAQAIFGIPFYLWGILARRLSVSGFLEKNIPLLLGVGGMMLALAVYWNSPVNFLVLQFGHYGFFLLGAVGGVMALTALSLCLAKWVGRVGLVQYIGENTLLICGFHLIAFSFLKGLMVYVLHLPLTVLEQSVFPCLLFSFLSLLCCIPLIWVEKKIKGYMGDEKNSDSRIQK